MIGLLDKKRERQVLLMEEDWKIANVVPLRRAARKPGKYRLVSLTSVVGNILENTCRDRFICSLKVKN